jgi:HAD superfamily hydrolase (TIGR01662 family)
MKIEGIGFDYGNTLVIDPFDKVMKLKANDFVAIMEANRYEISGRKLVKAWSEVNGRMNYPFCSHFCQEIPLVRAVLERLKVKRSDRFRICQQLLVSYRSGLKYVLKNDPAIPSVRNALAELKRKGKRLIILSNERVYALDMQLQWTGLAGYFEKIIASGKLGIEKPDPRIFRNMVRAFDLPESKILFVGDDPERDIRPAKALGMKACLVEQPGSRANAWRDYAFKLADKEKPDFVIRSIEELPALIG